jgi:hypothetical protein
MEHSHGVDNRIIMGVVAFNKSEVTPVHKIKVEEKHFIDPNGDHGGIDSKQRNDEDKD